MLRRIDRQAFESVLLQWLEAVLADTQPRVGSQADHSLQGVAFDGKALRGASSNSLFPGLSVVSAYRHRLGDVLGSEPFSQGKELDAVRTLLERVDLEGQVVTADALATHADGAESIVTKKKRTLSLW